MKTLSLISILALSVISLSSVSATMLPSASPDGITPANGLFATYFQNIASTPTCPPPLIITGFDSTLKPLCSGFGNMLGGFIGPQPPPVSMVTPVLSGFNPTTGSPQYMDVNQAIISYLAGLPTTPPGQVLAGFGPGGVPVYTQGSAWNMNGPNTYFTGGNVSIGTSSTPVRLSVMETVAGLTTGIQISGQHTPGITAWGVINSQDESWTTRPLTLQSNGGTVGIWTNRPVEALDVNGTIGLNSVQYIRDANIASSIWIPWEQQRLGVYNWDGNFVVANFDNAGTYQSPRFFTDPSWGTTFNGPIQASWWVYTSNGWVFSVNGWVFWHVSVWRDTNSIGESAGPNGYETISIPSWANLRINVGGTERLVIWNAWVYATANNATPNHPNKLATEQYVDSKVSTSSVSTGFAGRVRTVTNTNTAWRWPHAWASCAGNEVVIWGGWSCTSVGGDMRMPANEPSGNAWHVWCDTAGSQMATATVYAMCLCTESNPTACPIPVAPPPPPPPPPTIWGCTTIWADNYNPAATMDDGSCTFSYYYGGSINSYDGCGAGGGSCGE